MKVLGHEISQETIDRALNWFPPDRSFTFSDFQTSLTRHGVHFSVADRAADRILQKAKRAGTHSYSGTQWKRTRTDRGE